MNMSILKLPVRYFQDSTPEDVPCREENFIRREIEMSVPVNQTAMVLVDLWNVHFIDSWLERAARVTREKVVPAIRSAREAGLTIIHAPSPEVANQYPQTARNAITAPKPTSQDGPDWPPHDFRSRDGDYRAYANPRDQAPGIGARWDVLKDSLAVSPAVEVQEDDVVIATGNQLHRTLADRGILHLVYAGFATNWCVLGRDYGIRAMAGYGYNIIMLREATAGVEFPDTLDDLMVTEISIREIEQQFGFTVSNDAFYRSCARVASK
jgi:nicotinamidase-related amidase